jgi:CheY-like chemotaxis protein
MDTPSEERDYSMEIQETVEPEHIKVMVVEDNMINRKILVKILSTKLNIDVIEAEDGSVAVELFRNLKSPVIGTSRPGPLPSTRSTAYDTVLLDINMPKMDGYQASTEMRAIEKETNRNRSIIIAVTALASEDERHRGLVECGMDRWLTKPCDKPTIIKNVEQARKEVLGE